MIIYRCDRCGKDIDKPSYESYVCLDVERRNWQKGFSSPIHYLFCEDCAKSFEDFVNGLEVVAP